MKPKGAIEHKWSADLGGLWFCRAMNLIAEEAERIGASWIESSGEIIVSADSYESRKEPLALAAAHKLTLKVDREFEVDEWALVMQLGPDEIIFWSPGA